MSHRDEMRRLNQPMPDDGPTVQVIKELMREEPPATVNFDPVVIHPSDGYEESVAYLAPPSTPEQLEARARTLLNDANIVRVAGLLEVEPCEKATSPIAISTSDGRIYDWFELVSAHLRRMA